MLLPQQPRSLVPLILCSLVSQFEAACNAILHFLHTSGSCPLIFTFPFFVGLASARPSVRRGLFPGIYRTGKPNFTPTWLISLVFQI